MENNIIVQKLNDEYLKIKNIPNVANEFKDEIIDKENPNYNQDFTDNTYEQLVLSKKDVEEILSLIKNSDNISPEIKEKYTIDFQNLLQDISKNMSDISPFVSNELLNTTGGRRKRKTKSKRKSKAKNKSHKRKQTNKRKSKAKRKSKRK